MKKCNKCSLQKPLTEFFKDKNNKTDGRYSICKTCKTEGALKWRAENRAKYNETQRIYHAENYQRLRIQRYDLTPEQHAKMLSDQKGVCAICGELPKGKRPLAIDHNHDTGKVRGLLCYGCNRALHILDNQELLNKAMEYLKRNEG